MRTNQRTLVASIVLAVSLWAGGCSWMVVRTTPEDYSPSTAQRPPDCTASLGPAIGDTWDTIAVGGGLVTTGILTLTELSVRPVFGIIQIATGAVAGGVFGISAYHGYTHARRCRRMRDQFQIDLRARLDRLDRKDDGPSDSESGGDGDE